MHKKNYQRPHFDIRILPLSRSPALQSRLLSRANHHVWLLISDFVFLCFSARLVPRALVQRFSLNIRLSIATTSVACFTTASPHEPFWAILFLVIYWHVTVFIPISPDIAFLVWLSFSYRQVNF